MSDETTVEITPPSGHTVNDPIKFDANDLLEAAQQYIDGDAHVVGVNDLTLATTEYRIGNVVLIHTDVGQVGVYDPTKLAKRAEDALSADLADEYIEEMDYTESQVCATEIEPVDKDTIIVRPSRGGYWSEEELISISDSPLWSMVSVEATESGVAITLRRDKPSVESIAHRNSTLQEAGEELCTSFGYNENQFAWNSSTAHIPNDLRGEFEELARKFDVVFEREEPSNVYDDAFFYRYTTE